MAKITENNNRRDFLKKGIAVGALSATAMAVTAFQTDTVEESGEKVKLLSPDGEIVEVDSAYIKPVPEVYISPKEARTGIPDKKMVMVID
ncbi:MAG: twin-arginine translocation signal domain-containing protein, partial [Saprospiraceae bacterium]